MIGWILGIVGVVGIGGFIALAILAPPLAKVAVEIVQGILARMLETRIGVGALTAAVCLTFGYFYFDHEGYTRCRNAWRMANATAEAKAVKADNAAADKAEAEDRKNTQVESETEKSNAEARDAYIKDLEKRASSVCADSDNDVKRLRDIK